MKKFLFVDDMRERYDTFVEQLSNHCPDGGWELDYAQDYYRAVALLDTRIYDKVWLDHDLSESDIMCDPKQTRSKTGSDIAKFIGENLSEERRPKEVIVHSLNPVGAENMINILGDYGIKASWIPFGWKILNITFDGGVVIT
jgi:hypothetical protein